MKYIKFAFLVGLSITLTACSSSGRPTVPSSLGVYGNTPYFSTRDAFKEVLMTHQPSERELKAKEALSVYLQQFDNYGFVHSESPAPGQIGYDEYINENGTPAFRFSYAYFSEKHDGVVLVSLWDDHENQSARPRNVVKNIKDEYELTIPSNSFCSSNLNVKELSEELTDVLQGLSPGRKSKMMRIQQREGSIGAWAFHPGAFRLGNDASVDSVVNIVTNNHMTYVEAYHIVPGDDGLYRFVPSRKGFKSVSGCLLKTTRLNLVNKLTSS